MRMPPNARDRPQQPEGQATCSSTRKTTAYDPSAKERQMNGGRASHRMWWVYDGKPPNVVGGGGASVTGRSSIRTTAHRLRVGGGGQTARCRALSSMRPRLSAVQGFNMRSLTSECTRSFGAYPVSGREARLLFMSDSKASGVRNINRLPQRFRGKTKRARRSGKSRRSGIAD